MNAPVFQSIQHAPGNDPLYESTLTDRGGGWTKSTAIYDGSLWLGEVYLLRDGRYALVTRLRHPESGRLQAVAGTREMVQGVIRALTHGALCATRPVEMSPIEEANAAWGEHMAEVKGEDHAGWDCSTCEDLGDLYAEAAAKEAAANYGQSPEEEPDIPWCDFCGGEGHTAVAHDR